MNIDNGNNDMTVTAQSEAPFIFRFYNANQLCYALNKKFIATTFLKTPDIKGRKNLFGRADLAVVYRRTQAFIIQHRIFRIVQVSKTEDEIKRMTICNLWRIDRSPDGMVKTFEFELNQERWIETSSITSLQYWPDVPFWPIKQTQSLDWWTQVVKQAIWKTLIAAGYHQLPRHLSKGQDKTEAGPFKPEMAPKKMAAILMSKYLGQDSSHAKSKKQATKSGLLKPDTMIAGARALRAAIFHHLLDKDILSTALAIDYFNLSLLGYLQYAIKREAVLRIAREHRNLLPLLPMIHVDYWDRKDLFSFKLWVRGKRTRTLVDYVKFNSNQHSLQFSSFKTRAAYRWLCKAQLSVVRRWATACGGKHPVVIENLAKANITVRIPAIAWSHLMDCAWRLNEFGVCEPVQRLYRLYANHVAMIWEKQDFAAVKQWLRIDNRNDGANLSDLVDWLRSEGLSRGHPDKHATWASLQKRSAEWHTNTCIANMVRSKEENMTWESLIQEIDIDGVTFTSLNSTKDMVIEGHRQHHCVGTYDIDCLHGYYRAYTAVEPDGTRSTLGLRLIDNNAWEIDQHRGKCNGSVSALASNAGEQLRLMYQLAFQMGRKT